MGREREGKENGDRLPAIFGYRSYTYTIGSNATITGPLWSHITLIDLTVANILHLKISLIATLLHAMEYTAFGFVVACNI